MTFHSYYGIFWVTFVLAAILVPLLRASYDSVTLELMRLFGVHRRTLLVGPFGELSELRRTLKRDGRGPDINVIGTVSEHAGGPSLPDSPALGALADLEQIVAEQRPNDVVMTGFELSDRRARLARRHLSFLRRPPARRPHDDRAAAQPRDLRARPVRAAVRGAPARPDRHRLGDQAHVRHRRVRAARRHPRHPGPDRGAVVRLTSSGPAIYRDPAHRRRRAASSRCSSSVRCGRAPPSCSRPSSRSTTRPAGHLQDARRPARDARRAASCAASRSTSCRSSGTSCAAR